MVGLIPKINFLYIPGSCSSPKLTDNKELKEFFSKDGIELIEIPDEEDIKELIKKFKPEILIIEESAIKELDIVFSKCNTKQCNPYTIVKLEDFCEKELFNADKHIKYLKAGADEVLDANSIEELFLKSFSYLKRKQIFQLNEVTQLPGINRTYSVIDHCRRELSDWVLMHIDTSNLKSLNTLYGMERGDKAIQEIGRILIKASKESSGEIFVGHIGRDNFVVVCSSSLQETLQELILKNFEKILPKLYKETDYENNYVICPGPHKVRRKEPLLDLEIGLCNNIDRSFSSGSDIVEHAIQNKKSQIIPNKKVLILEDDNDFGQLITDTLNYQGFETRLAKGLRNLVKEVEEFGPRILILEASSIGLQNFPKLNQKLEKYKKEKGLKILVATNIPGYQNFLSAGADVYLPKPYDLEVLFREVRRLRFSSL
jgi:GGDEF domain-containing protein